MTANENSPLIFLVEDDASLGESLKTLLCQNFRIVWITRYQEALKEFHLEHKNISLVLMDIGLPDGNGFDLAMNFRTISAKPPILFLTAQADAESRLRGFELGAVDFIPKPFHLKELLLRISNALSSSQVPGNGKKSESLILSDCQISFVHVSVTKNSGEIIYPPVSDLKVLQHLVESSPKAISRDEIIDEIWGVDENVSHRTVDNVIVRLRQMIGENDKDKIRSVRGIGYQWVPTIKTNSPPTTGADEQ